MIAMRQIRVNSGGNVNIRSLAFPRSRGDARAMPKDDNIEQAAWVFWALAILCIIGGVVGAINQYPQSDALDYSRIAAGFEWAWRMVVVAVMFHGLVLLKRLAPP